MREKKKLTLLQGTVLLLTGLYRQIRCTLRILEQKRNGVDRGLKFVISNYTLILICSFLEEWRRLEAMGKNNEIQITLKIASPFLDRIRKWKGLQKVRSRLLAHPHRDKQGRIAFPWEVFSKYECPTAYAEIILLGKCAIRAIDVVYVRHHDEYIQAVAQISQDREHIEIKGIRTEAKIKAEFKNIEGKMVKIKEEICEEPT